MIAGLETITGGRVQIGGREVKDVESKNRDIARVFQSYALYPHLSVRDNIAFALTLRTTPKHEITKRVEEAARILELTENLDRRPGQLSGGQRQRVARGRVIVRQPQAFLMDEPLSNLDAKLRFSADERAACVVPNVTRRRRAADRGSGSADAGLGCGCTPRPSRFRRARCSSRHPSRAP